MSLMLFDPVGSSLRTSLLSELAAGTGYSGTWSDSATPARRSWWVLSTSEPPTGGTASSSWPTPTMGDGERQSETYMGGNPTLRGAAVSWPTPNAMDGERGAESRETKAARGAGGVNLREAANWATPAAQDAKNATLPPSQRGRDSVVGNVMQWQTPTVADTTGGHACRGGDRADELLLVGQARQDIPSTPGKPRGSLNSRWVATLMGFPEDWCELPTDTLSALTATRSSRRSRKSSGPP